MQLSSKFINSLESQIRMIPTKEGTFTWHPLYDLKDFPFDFEVKERESFLQQENSSENCFKWYKNLNLPNINVKLRFQSHQFQIPQFKASIISLKKEQGSQRLTQSQMRGKSTLNFMNDEVEFKQIKFSETSYKNGKCRFYLALLIQDPSNEENPIQSYLSPQLFLESRRKTFPETIITLRQNDMTDQRYNLFNPFLPIATEIILEKGSKAQNNSESIGKDLQGILDYFSCPTVRNKIFHPLFLFMRFPEVINLYYNKDLVKLEPDSDSCEFLNELLFQIFISLNPNKQNFYKNQSNRPLLLSLEADPEKNHFEIQKITKYIKPLEGPALNFIATVPESHQKSSFPNFEKLQFEEYIQEAYRLIYPGLSSLNYQLKVEGIIPYRSETNTAKNLNFSDGQGSSHEIFEVKVDQKRRSQLIHLRTTTEKDVLNQSQRKLNQQPLIHEIEKVDISNHSKENCSCHKHNQSNAIQANNFYNYQIQQQQQQQNLAQQMYCHQAAQNPQFIKPFDSVNSMYPIAGQLINQQQAQFISMPPQIIQGNNYFQNPYLENSYHLGQQMQQAFFTQPYLPSQAQVIPTQTIFSQNPQFQQGNFSNPAFAIPSNNQNLNQSFSQINQDEIYLQNQTHPKIPSFYDHQNTTLNSTFYGLENNPQLNMSNIADLSRTTIYNNPPMAQEKEKEFNQKRNNYYLQENQYETINKKTHY